MILGSGGVTSRTIAKAQMATKMTPQTIVIMIYLRFVFSDPSPMDTSFQEKSDENMYIL